MTGTRNFPPGSLVAWGFSLACLLASHFGLALNFGAARRGYLGFAIDEGFLFEYGIILAVVGLGCLILHRTGTSLAQQVRLLGHAMVRAFRGRNHQFGVSERRWAYVVLLIATVALWCRRQPLSYDEAFTSIYFLHGGLSGLFYYPLPNNHILYTVLVAPLVWAFGEGAGVLRTPSILAFLASALLMLRVGRLVSAPHGGYLASAVMASLPFLVAFGGQARGYSLLVLLTVVSLWVLADDECVDERSKPVLLAVVGALALLTMPSAAYQLGMVAAWGAGLSWRRAGRKALLSFLTIHVVMGVVFVAILLVPVLLINRLPVITSNRFFRPLPMAEFLQLWPDHLASSARELTQGVPSVALLILALLACLGMGLAVRRHRSSLLEMMPAAAFGLVLVFLAKRSIPFSRTWIFVLPILVLAADFGFSAALARWRPGLRALVILPLGMAALLICPTDGQIPSQRRPGTGVSPHARTVATLVAQSAAPTDWLCARVPEDALLRYYLVLDHPVPATAFGGDGRVFYVVPQQSTARLPPGARLVSGAGDLAVYLLARPTSIEAAGAGFHCWLRGGFFFG